MLKKLIFIFSVCSLSVPAFDQLIYEFDDTLQEKRFYSLISEIRCPKCTSGSIASSDVPVSRDLKNKVYELIISGSSDQEIKAYVSKGLVISQIIDRHLQELIIFCGLGRSFSLH